MCCTRLTGNTGRKNDAKNRYLRSIAQLCQALSSQLRHVSPVRKILLSSNISPACPYNMVNFGLLVAEIVSLAISTGFASWQHYCTASSSGRQPNCGVEQRAPPILGRAAITLGIGPHF